MKRGTQKLTMDMFRSRTKTGKREAKNLLFPLAMRLTSEDIVERPKWLNAMEKVNPAKTAVGVDSFMAEKKGKITYPEDKLIRAYYNRRPLASWKRSTCTPEKEEEEETKRRQRQRRRADISCDSSH